MRVIYKNIEGSIDKPALALKLIKNVGIEKIPYTLSLNTESEPVEDNSDKALVTQRTIIGSGLDIAIDIKNIIYIENMSLEIFSAFSENAELLIYTPRDIVAKFAIGNKTGVHKFGFTESDVTIHDPYPALSTGIPVMLVDDKYCPMLIYNGEDCKTVSFKIINNTNENALSKITVVTKPVPAT